ncbi:hypothetical protein Tco_0353599 [Tanacetum coccineum]
MCGGGVKYFFHYSPIAFQKFDNSSFPSVDSKTPEAKMVKDFRPISLIGSLYKIIAKILANRLVVVLGDIVNEVHRILVRIGKLLGTIILNEVLHRGVLVGNIGVVGFKMSFDLLGIGFSEWKGAYRGISSFFKGLKQGACFWGKGRNSALMCAMGWRFTTQKNLLWTRVNKAIHGEDGKMVADSRLVTSPFGEAFSRRWKH